MPAESVNGHQPWGEKIEHAYMYRNGEFLQTCMKSV